MCLSCGCGLCNDDHGNSNNITYSQLLKAMVAGNVPSPVQVLSNMADCYQKMVNANDTDSDDDSPPGTYDATGRKLDADKGDGPGTVANDPNYLRNNTQYV